jgi:predicted CoA-substrate-specific enzyme activase
MEKFIGLDAGSVSVKIALLDDTGRVIETRYVRHKGRPLTTAYDLLRDMDPAFPLSVTGTAGRLIADVLGMKPVNEIVAQSYSTRRLYPDIRTIIEMGGEDSKLILLQDGKIKEFSMNSVCAAGTGSFLDQQAERLNLSIEEFSEIALESKTPPRIAGRCSVFAKSDMIHLQQIATPLKDIVAGLCFAVARNFKGSICKNMELPEPVSFQGGVAANKGVVRAYREVFHLESLLIPEHFALMPAIGVALKNIEEKTKNYYEVERLKDFISIARGEEKEGLEPLKNINTKSRTCLKKDKVPGPGEIIKTSNRHVCPSPVSAPHINAYIGIDVGSISTNLAVIDEEGRLLAKRYLMTAGRPIEAVRQGLDEIGREIGDTVEILGAGTTGSGRYMIADFVGADIVKNEITAQARAAVEIDPQVDTIFEIGGQDSKYISLKDGVIIDFEMNKACAAGTGSFLEEQAEKLGISIKEEFSDIAFQSRCPSPLGERCTVFMENSLLARQQRGVPKKDLVAGLSYSIVQNYINRVVGDRKIGDRIFFQGGTAYNKAVVTAFEKYTGRDITVPPDHDVTGAIGMAIIAKEHHKSLARSLASGRSNGPRVEATGLGAKQWASLESDRSAGNVRSTFKGFDLSKRKYSVNSFECKGCDNLCEINKVKIDGEDDPLFYGSRCEKYDVKRKKKYVSDTDFPDLFSEREALLTEAHRGYKKKSEIRSVARIGIPRIFFFHDFLPFWSTLLWELGFQVEISGETKRQLINKGVESILSESCFPHKVAHGHIKDLIERGVDAILIPSFMKLNSGNDSMGGFACPYVQTMPYIADIAFRENGGSPGKPGFLKPVVNSELGENHLLLEIHRALTPFGISKKAVKRAFLRAKLAQETFFSAIKKRGRDVLRQIDKKTIVILGRSYNAFDPGVNLEIPKKLSDIGVFSIPMDFLPLEDINIQKTWPNMYWRSGQNLLKAAEIIRRDPKLFALYIGNFSCGPDSFIQRFFKETIADKPFLHIEIDEHSADAGVVTRCEAFLDSIINRRDIPVKESKRVNAHSLRKGQKKKIIYVPRMSDHAFAIASAFQSCGLDSEVMDIPDARTITIGRKYVSGKECYPCAITTGDMVKKTMSKDFDPTRAVFFMPSGSGPCRFGQYNIFHRLVLDETGFPEVPIFSPNQDASFYNELGMIGNDFTKQAWKGVTVTDILTKCLHETRPYEKNKGETDAVYEEYLQKIQTIVRSKNGAASELLREMRSSFSGIRKTSGRKPLIGIIGEIFVRLNAFSNEDIVRKVETLGGEVWLAPMEEWLYYVNMMASRKAFLKWKKNIFSKKCIDDILSVYITNYIQKRIEHRFSKPFKTFLKTLKEPSTKELFINASPYLHDSFEGETILSIGKAIDFVKKGASGIISTMPFGCMPGTIVEALLKGIKEDTDIPFLSIAYDGAEANCSEIRLEAFMHQAGEYGKTMDRKRNP